MTTKQKKKVVEKKKPELVLTNEQNAAIDFVVSQFKNKRAETTMGGLAGTGKTTIIGYATAKIRKKKKDFRVAFSAFTGKAASVLKSKLERAEALGPKDYVGTIHGLIYTPIMEDGLVVGWERTGSIPYDLIVVDEASMVNEDIYKDLKTYGVPIIAVGDHGQLPPINGRFNLMENPMMKLETIHRQAANDPIVQCALAVREGRSSREHLSDKCGTDIGRHSKVRWLPSPDKAEVVRAVSTSIGADKLMWLCGYNKTRVMLNFMIRRKLGITSADPVKGDRVICLRNNRYKKIYNGVTGVIQKIEDAGEHHFQAQIAMDTGDVFRGKISRHQFGREKTINEWPGLEPKEIGQRFDFGYCMTVHKAQGSESDKVLVFEERFPMSSDSDWNKWRYTAYTRAAKELIIVGKLR